MTDKTSYLFMSRRKRQKCCSRIMSKHSSTDSDISLDSLETSFKLKTNIKGAISDENVDTILVPFYENDVLIKVPKDQKRIVKTNNKHRKSRERFKKETSQCYLVNKSKRTTYLETFRKQFYPNYVEKKVDLSEIRSLSAEYGDTERESIEDNVNNVLISDFYNTESYNDIYYEKLLNRDFQARSNICESLDDLQFPDDVRLETSSENIDQNENFKSISEVSPPRRSTKRIIIGPVPAHNLKLGGLGPDMEKIKPRLERARSLQRYSEKVRMENRLKIYKKTVQAETDNKIERGKCSDRCKSPKERDISRERCRPPIERCKSKVCRSGKELKNLRDDISNSYLVNRIGNDRSTKVKTIKSKSADAQRTKEKIAEKDNKQRSASKGNEKRRPESKYKPENRTETSRQNSGRPSRCSRPGSKNKGINTESSEVTPVQISFSVNIGVRPSSALRTLEEKHRMYQDQVKAFMNGNNNG